MNLSGLAKTYEAYGGELILHFMPYNTIGTRLAHIRMKEATDGALDEDASAYVTIIGRWVDCTLGVSEDELSSEARGMFWYWNNRTGGIVEDYKLYTMALPMGALDVLTDAYISTRDELPKAPEELREGMPLAEDNPLNGKPGKKRGKAKSSR